eukprot:TRINITY_DN9460_c1_g1_i1.p1 TRINITY_DN9460_c1_g1~~TRINITY_DN9460_c1_g1_i1.p1  ORF type:complete len:942 (+),score=208.82 TRINITY_DN9460_c1_g1_i1:3-2828(+)
MMMVVEPMNAGLGGDLMAIVADEDARPQGWMASGFSPLDQTLSDMKLRVAQHQEREEYPIPKHGPLSITTPGVVAGLCGMHRKHGRLPWTQLFQSAIDAAHDGVDITLRTAYNFGQVSSIVTAYRKGLLSRRQLYDFIAMYAPGGLPPLPGERYHNPALAHTLALIAKDGCDGFYKGAIAKEMIAAWQSNDLTFTMQDLQHTGDRAATNVELMETRFDSLKVYGLPSNSGSAAALAMLDVLNTMKLIRMPEEYLLFAQSQVKRAVYTTLRTKIGHDHQELKLRKDEILTICKAVQMAWKRKQPLELPLNATALQPDKGADRDDSQLDDDDEKHDEDDDGDDDKSEQNKAVVQQAKQMKLLNNLFGKHKNRQLQSLVNNNHWAGRGDELPSQAQYDHGDTISMAFADSWGQQVSLLQSICQPFGSGIVSRRLGMVFQSRGAAFALDADADHPNLYGPGRRPFHTLTGFYVVDKSGKHRLGRTAVAMKGGSRQPYAFVKLLVDTVAKQISLAQALEQPRYLHADPQSRSPWYPKHYIDNSARGVALKYDLPHFLKLDVVQRLGQYGIELTPVQHHTGFYDSLFGVAAITQCGANGQGCFGLADVRRKPGLAIDGALGHDEIAPKVLPAVVKAGRGHDDGLLPVPQPVQGGICILAAYNQAWVKHIAVLGAHQIKAYADWYLPLAKRKAIVQNTLRECQSDDALVIITSNMKERAWFNQIFPNVANTAPRLEVMELLTSKELFHHWLVWNGFESNLPKLYQNSHFKPVKRPSVLANAFPVIIKILRGTASEGVFLAHDYEQARTHIRQLKTAYMVQEAVPGKSEFSANFLAFRGTIRRCNVYRFDYTEDRHIKAGMQDGRIGRQAHSCEQHPEGVAVAKRITRLADYTGIGCMQWKEPKPGVVKIIEVNARPCGSIVSDLEFKEWLIELAGYVNPAKCQVKQFL